MKVPFASALFLFFLSTDKGFAGILNPSRFSFPEGLNVKIAESVVHRLDSHSIQTDRLLEGRNRTSLRC